MAIHTERHPLAGKTVKIRQSATHNQDPEFGGSDFHVEDWADKVINCSWMDARGNPAALIYAMRSATNDLPCNDNVVYGKTDNGLGHLVHVTELIT